MSIYNLRIEYSKAILRFRRLIDTRKDMKIIQESGGLGKGETSYYSSGTTNFYLYEVDQIVIE